MHAVVALHAAVAQLPPGEVVWLSYLLSLLMRPPNSLLQVQPSQGRSPRSVLTCGRALRRLPTPLSKWTYGSMPHGTLQSSQMAQQSSFAEHNLVCGGGYSLCWEPTECKISMGTQWKCASNAATANICKGACSAMYDKE